MTFKGATYESALRQAKKSLGPDLILIKTLKRKEGGIFGFFTSQIVELTVGVGLEVPVARKPLPAKLAKPILSSVGQLKDDRIRSMDQHVMELKEEISSLKGMIERQHEPSSHEDHFGDLSAQLIQVYERLLSVSVEEPLAFEIVNKLNEQLLPGEKDNLEQIRAHLKKFVTGLIRVTGPIKVPRARKAARRAKVVALVGSTGVGKTTTLAKLAASYTINHGKDVAIITADTYRIAAVEQIRTFGGIVKIPVEVVITPKDLELAVAKHRERDLILIDTAGRSPSNQEQKDDLKAQLAVIDTVEIHLVISLTTKFKDILNIIECNQDIGYDRLLFTKLDETSCLGGLLNVLTNIDLPVSYVTTGQDVPDDIELASKTNICNAILKNLTG